MNTQQTQTSTLDQRRSDVVKNALALAYVLAQKARFENTEPKKDEGNSPMWF